MQSPLSCTLIFINWNSGALAVAAARSARATVANSATLRLLVVDNGSTDDSLARLRRELPAAELVEMGANRGFAAAANAGLARVRDRFALILNTDIEFRAGAIARLLEALAADERAVLACPRLLRPDGSEQAAAVPEPALLWELTSRSLARRFLRVAPDRPSAVPSIVGPCMAVDMERARAIGWLDERFFFFFEETDWCRRIRAAGGRILFVPTAAVVHLQGETANRRPIRARVQFHISRYRYFRKHGGRGAVALLYAGTLVRLSLNLLVYTLQTAVTLGRRATRDRLAVTATLWWWHLRLCRPRWGFEGCSPRSTQVR